MNDLELAEEIARHGLQVFGAHALTKQEAEQIIAALRRRPDEIDAAYALRMVRQPAFALMEYLLTQGPAFNIPDNIWIPFVDALSAEASKEAK